MAKPQPAKVPSRPHFVHHFTDFTKNAFYGAVMIVVSMAVGTIGFHVLAKQAWIDAWLNAAMLLGGMGPIGDLNAGGGTGKVFASLFALYAGLVVLITAGLLLTPVFHHVLRRFHLENDDRRE